MVRTMTNMHIKLNRPAKRNREMPTRRRTKLWDDDSSYHCSIIGTCLRRADLRKLARKKIFGLEAGVSDYDIHSAVVTKAGYRNPQSRALQKLLDTKYRAAINRYAKAGEDEEIRNLWQEDLHNGSVAGAYWSIMSHPLASDKIRADIYGEVHMMQHDYFELYKRDRRIMGDLKNKVRMLEEVMASERQHYLDEKRAMEQIIASMTKLQQQTEQTVKEVEELQDRNHLLETGLAENNLVKKLDDVREQRAFLRQKNAELLGHLDNLTEQLERNQEKLKLTEEKNGLLENQNWSLDEEKEELQNEIAALETAMMVNLAVTNSCSTCGDQDTDRCPGRDLCGKTVLYVGGQSKMIPRYRQMVERFGGRFMHHDGGVESSRSLLPKMLSSADAVMCPIDCVSHDACNCVKKICKRNQKPFVLMRSSGLSSLAKGLHTIVQ